MKLSSSLPVLTATAVAVASASEISAPQRLRSLSKTETRRLAATEVCYASFDDVDFFSGDVGTASGSSWGDCVQACADNSNCFSFTWTSSNGGSCWLKNGITTGVRMPGAVSGYVGRSSPNTACPVVNVEVKDVDFYGGDISEDDGSDASACYQQCRSIPDCKFYTWSPIGRCYFKSNWLTVQEAEGLVSGAIAQTERMYLDP